MSMRVLCVDDDEDLLSACRRVLQSRFEVDVATTGAAALELLPAAPPYSVVLSDMRMPGLDGIQFLARFSEAAPLTTRIMLTGDADQRTAAEAVNQGRIFRFLNKPCPSAKLIEAVEAGVRQYQLVTAERELLEQTLRGSVRLLTDVLALVNPLAFGRASRVQRLARAMAELLGVEAAWQVEVAAMLSQVGCVALPQEILEQVYHGRTLSADHAAMFESHPATGSELLRHIPRLDAVAQIVAWQEKRYDGSGPPASVPGGEALPLGARILKVTLDFDALVTGGETPSEALEQLRRRAGWYDPQVLKVLSPAIEAEYHHVARTVPLVDLLPGMVLVEDLLANGVLLVSRGHEVSPSMCARLRNYSRAGRLPEQVRVLVPRRSPVV